MSTEVPPPAAPKDPGNPVDPDNFHADSTVQAAPEGLLDPAKAKTKTPVAPTASGGTVSPDNFHADGAPTG